MKTEEGVEVVLIECPTMECEGCYFRETECPIKSIGTSIPESCVNNSLDSKYGIWGEVKEYE